MRVAIPKLTFRLYDNPLLVGSDLQIVIIDTERLPTLDYMKAQANHCWSYHQFNLLLQIIIGLSTETKILPLLVDREQLSTVLEIVDRHAEDVVTDHITDPAFEFFEEKLDDVFGSKLKHLSTFTLLDWRESHHRERQREYWSKATIYAKLTPLKDHILANITKPSDTVLSNNDSETETLECELGKYRINLSEMLTSIQRKMKEIGMHPHCFLPECSAKNDNNVSFSKQFMEYVKAQVALIDSDVWYKPDTAIGVDFGWKVDGKNELNGSQLSPFLSIGALSVKTFWSLIKSDNINMGGAKDQLLFRECFHATAIAAETVDVERVNHFWDNIYDNPFVKESDIEWNSDPKLLSRWQCGKMGVLENIESFDRADVWFDANESMCQLWINGWIHHLRRHLVADTLTRGGLGVDWRQGEAWFRYTLIDHDAAVNRSNWMWLSAVAFSSKQKVYHYSPLDYVRRKSRDDKIIARDDSEFFRNSKTPSRLWKRDIIDGESGCTYNGFNVNIDGGIAI